MAWRTVVQPIKATSSTEAEYYCLKASSSQVIWVRMFLAELGVRLKAPTVVFEDNQGAIALSNNPLTHSDARHIHISFHVTQERVARGFIQLAKIDSKHQLADPLTKSLAGPLFLSLRPGLVRPTSQFGTITVRLD